MPPKNKHILRQNHETTVTPKRSNLVCYTVLIPISPTQLLKSFSTFFWPGIHSRNRHCMLLSCLFSPLEYFHFSKCCEGEFPNLKFPTPFFISLKSRAYPEDGAQLALGYGLQTWEENSARNGHSTVSEVRLCDQLLCYSCLKWTEWSSFRGHSNWWKRDLCGGFDVPHITAFCYLFLISPMVLPGSWLWNKRG